jgi:DNA-binding transcriptional ArsR family regulator
MTTPRGRAQRTPQVQGNLVGVLRALDNERRLQILQWLKDPTGHFRPQAEGDLVEDGVCGLLIAEKLGLSQATVSEHMRLLVESGLVRAKRMKQWIFYRRDNASIAEFTRQLRREL